jgi:glycosyltransferase involved in cell wall biosynthesis
MIVDNGVVGDSRVQKAARSAADAGWDVVLLGVLGGLSPRHTWHIGDAEVRLLRVSRGLGRHPSQFQRSFLRRPLAYPPGHHGGYRVQLAKAWKAAVFERWTALEVARSAGGGRLRELAGKGVLLPARVVTKALGRWTRFRAGELRRLRRAQQNPDSWLTKLSISFWRTVRGKRSWRRLDRGLWDYELAFGPVINQLQPDVIHAHDFRMLGVGARAAMRARVAGRRTRLLWDAHEFVAGINGRADNPRWLPAQVAYVEEYAPYADAVVTVSDSLADVLQQTHGLRERPSVVLNAPMGSPIEAGPTAPPPALRTLCGVGAHTPLLVYSGAVNPVRGVDVMVEALPSLPDVHVALVALAPGATGNPTLDQLRARAAKLGVAERVHLLGYVPHWQVTQFLAAADAGVIPIHHKTNHELALITKFLEYSHARLPIVVSDVRTMAATTRATGQGEVFRAGDVEDYARAVKAVLGEPARYRAAYESPGLLKSWTWEAQAEILEATYVRLMTDPA